MTIKKHEIEWNVHHANDIETNPIDFLYCFQGDSTRDSSICVYKVLFQNAIGKNGYPTYCDDIFKAKYFILYILSYHKKSEKHDPYGDEWYLNYTTIDQIAMDYDLVFVYESLEEIEHRINNRSNELAYMLSYLAESPEEAKEASEKNGIISISSHPQRYDGYRGYQLSGQDSLADIAGYFNEFGTSIGILSTKIYKDRIYLHLDGERNVIFQIKNDKGYLEHWMYDDKEGTLCTFMTYRAFDAVRWLLALANHELPLNMFGFRD